MACLDLRDAAPHMSGSSASLSEASAAEIQRCLAALLARIAPLGHAAIAAGTHSDSGAPGFTVLIVFKSGKEVVPNED